MKDQEVKAGYVPELIKFVEGFAATDELKDSLSNRDGKRQFATLVEAAQNASCVEELCLYIKYKKSKEGTKKYWKSIADPLAKLIREKVVELASEKKVDPLIMVKEFLGFLMWRVCIFIEEN